MASCFWSINEGLAIGATSIILGIYLFYYFVKYAQAQHIDLNKILIYFLPIALIILLFSYFFYNSNILLFLENPKGNYQKIIKKTHSFIGGKNQTAMFLTTIITFMIYLSTTKLVLLGNNKEDSDSLQSDNHQASFFSIPSIKKNLRIFLIGEQNILNLIAIILGIFSLLILGSRNSFVAIFFFLLTLMIINKPNFKKIAFLFLGIAILFFLYFQIVSPDNFVEQLQHNSYNSRFNYWKRTFELFLQYPIYGLGLGQWGIYKYDLLRLSRVPHPHNDLLRILTELGIIGAVLYYSLIVMLITRLSKLIRQANNQIQKLNYSILLGIIISACSLSLLDEMMFNLNIQLFLMIVWASINHQYQALLPYSDEIKWHKQLIFANLLLGFMMLFFSILLFNSFSHIEKGRTLERAEKHEKALEEYSKAYSSIVNQVYETPIHYKQYKLLEALNRKDEAIVALKKADAEFPFHQSTAKELFLYYLNQKSYLEALKQIEKLSKAKHCDKIVDECIEKFNAKISKAETKKLEAPINQTILFLKLNCVRKKDRQLGNTKTFKELYDERLKRSSQNK